MKSSPPPILSTKIFRPGTHSKMCYLNSKLTQAKPNRTYQNSASTSKTVASDALQSHSLSSKFSYSSKSKNLYSMLTKTPSSSSSSSQNNNDISSLSSSPSSSPNKSLNLFEAKSKMVKSAQEDLIKTEAKLQCLKTTYAKLCSSAQFRTAACPNSMVQEIIHPKDTVTQPIASPVKEKPSPKLIIKQPTCFMNTTKSHVVKPSLKISHTKSNVSLKSWIKTPSAKTTPLISSSLTAFPQQFSSQHLSTVAQKQVPQFSKSLKSPLVQCHRYKFVRKPGVKKPMTSLSKTTKVLKQNNFTTPFKLIKNQSSSSASSSTVSLPLRKTGYSYFSSKSLLRARALNRNTNSVIAKDYKKRLAALLIDFGKVAYRPKKLASSSCKQKLTSGEYFHNFFFLTLV